MNAAVLAPRRGALAPETPERYRASTSGNACRGRVLVIEPEADLADVLVTGLERAGFLVDTAEDGLDAVFAIEQASPNLVVLDLNVPTISGFRLVRLLKRDPSTCETPVILVSDLSFQEAREAVREGVDAFLTMPVTPGEVVQHAERLLHLEPLAARPIRHVAAGRS